MAHDLKSALEVINALGEIAELAAGLVGKSPFGIILEYKKITAVMEDVSKAVKDAKDLQSEIKNLNADDVKVLAEALLSTLGKVVETVVPAG